MSIYNTPQTANEAANTYYAGSAATSIVGGYIPSTTTTTAVMTTTGGYSNSSGTLYYPYDASTGSASYLYVNAVKAKAIMAQLHPDPAWSDWTIRLWDERRDDLHTTAVPNVLRARNARLYFVVYNGELLVAAKSWATAVRCASVLDIVNP